MRVIPTRVHGILDYLGALALFFAPDIFGFAAYGGPAVTIPRILAVVFLVQSLLTRYELGVFKVLPMSTHLLIDVLGSIFLAVSPFLFGFSDEPGNVWLPHVIVGVAYLLISLMTRTTPDNYDETGTTTNYSRT